MNNMNTVHLIGRLTDDCFYKALTGDEKHFLTFDIAVNIRDNKVVYPKITVFGKPAVKCKEYLRKGTKVAIIGRIETYPVKENGKNIKKMSIVAEKIEFIESKKQETYPILENELSLEEELTY